MKAPPEVFVVAVKSMRNDLLVERGWSEGDVVRLADSEWLDAKTFEPGFEAHPSRDEAERAVATAGSHFVGVEFEVLPYVAYATEFVECDRCRSEPGTPTLCPGCLERRLEHGRTGRCRPPRKSSPEPEEVVLHYKTHLGQPYGSVSRKCSECGTRLWIASDGRWTGDHAVWRNPPPGFRNCSKTTP